MANHIQFGGEKVRIFPYDTFGQSMLVATEHADSFSSDAFGRSRVSAPTNRSDIEFIYDKQPLLFDDISAGNGSATHQANARDVLLAVGGTAAADVGGMRQHYWTPYTPGNSQLVELTGTLDNAGIGGGTAYAFLRSTVTGSTTLEAVPIADWVFDGSVVDWGNSHIFAIDFQSLKVGRIRFGMIRGGRYHVVTEINNDDTRSTGFWQYPSLPPYWKIYNDGGNTVSEIGYGDDSNGIGFRYVFNGIQSTATMRAICATVKSEGGVSLFDLPGFPFSTPIMATTTTSTTLIPILSIRVKALFNSLANRSLVIPTSYGVQTDNPIDYQIIYRPTLTGASWVDVNTSHSGVEYDISATAITGGVVVDTQALSSGNNRTIGEERVLDRVIMSLGSSGTADILTVAAVRSGAADAEVKAAFGWKEIR